MTPEEEWLRSSMQHARERSMWRDMLQAPQRPSHHQARMPWGWVVAVIVLVILGAFWK